MSSIQGLLVLGLLAERPWTAYELVRYLTRPSMAAFFWNASESTWYREPARLVAAGLAEASEAGDGSPTLYTITDAGRQALAASGARDHRFVHRSEAMAILYATAGSSLEELDDRLATLHKRLLDTVEEMAAAMHGLAESGPVLARRAPVSALLARFAARAVTLSHDWAIEARRELQALGSDGDRATFAREIWREVARDLDRFVAARRAAERG